MANNKFKEAARLVKMLTAARVPFEHGTYLGGPIIWYPDKKDCVIDAICHPGSYGYEVGLLEIMDHRRAEDVEGWLNAEEVFEKILSHWQSQS